jgi:hypothetical protein
VALTIVLACCVFLVAWICVLALTLPSQYRAGGWRGAWVGFDIVELFGFAAVAWFAWRGKQLLVVALIVTSTLLCCDAWFDLTLDWGTRDFSFSVFSAICGELPLALLMILGARRLLRLTVATTMAAQGNLGPVPPLWQVPLMGTGPGEPHGPRLRPVRDVRDVPGSSPDGQADGSRAAPGQPPGPDPAGDRGPASYPG